MSSYGNRDYRHDHLNPPKSRKTLYVSNVNQEKVGYQEMEQIAGEGVRHLHKYCGSFFIKFKQSWQAAQARDRLNGMRLHGKRLYCDFAKERPQSRNTSNHSHTRYTSRSRTRYDSDRLYRRSSGSYRNSKSRSRSHERERDRTSKTNVRIEGTDNKYSNHSNNDSHTHNNSNNTYTHHHYYSRHNPIAAQKPKEHPIVLLSAVLKPNEQWYYYQLYHLLTDIIDVIDAMKDKQKKSELIRRFQSADKRAIMQYLEELFDDGHIPLQRIREVHSKLHSDRTATQYDEAMTEFGAILSHSFPSLTVESLDVFIIKNDWKEWDNLTFVECACWEGMTKKQIGIIQQLRVNGYNIKNVGDDKIHSVCDGVIGVEKTGKVLTWIWTMRMIITV
eukprot:194129_1